MKFANNPRLRSLALLIFVGVITSLNASAHCDTLNGPVITDARRALDTGNVVTVLKWIHPEHEAEVRQAFARTLRVRAQGGEARELADRFFFETVVRLHRSGEGEPYTGLKESAEIEPVVSAADKALATGAIDILLKHIDSRHVDAVRPRFVRAVETRQRADDSLTAGREYVAAYVELVHYVHSLQEGAAEEGGHDHSQSEAAPKEVTAQIEQFSTSTTRLKKNTQAKLMLTFQGVPAGGTVDWRLSCEGVAIIGWDSKQVLNISERTAAGAIQTIEGHGFLGTNPGVAIIVKRQKEQPARDAGSCTATLAGGASEETRRTVQFEFR